MGSEDIYFESYRLISELGSGAFGVVYMAQHAILTNRIVAIKIMLPDYAENEKAIIHFFRESQFLEELKHPYILPIINAGIYNGLPYQVTEYASKGSLRDRLKRQPTYPLPIALLLLFFPKLDRHFNMLMTGTLFTAILNQKI